MAIPLDIFTRRLNKTCEDMERGMVALKKAFDADIAALDAETKGAEPHELLALKAIGDARLADMERRLAEALGG